MRSNAASFLPLLAVFATIPRELIARDGGASGGIREAVAVARRRPLLVAAFIWVGTFSLLIGPIQELAPVIAHEHARGAHVVGFLLGALAAGSVIGSVVVSGRFTREGRPRYYVMSAAGGLAGLAVVALALAPSLPVALLAMAMAGVFWEVFFVLALTGCEVDAPPELVRARARSLLRADARRACDRRAPYRRASRCDQRAGRVAHRGHRHGRLRRLVDAPPATGGPRHAAGLLLSRLGVRPRRALGSGGDANRWHPAPGRLVTPPAGDGACALGERRAAEELAHPGPRGFERVPGGAQVQTPGAGALRALERLGLVEMLLETLRPLTERLGVVRVEVLRRSGPRSPRARNARVISQRFRGCPFGKT